MKIVIGVVVAVVALLAVGVMVLFARLDSIVEQTVEKEGTSQLSLATELSAADVSVFGGSVTLDGLTIDNPQGYAAPHLFELGQVNVAVSYGDLTKTPVRIRQININSPRLVIERGSVGGLAEQLRLNVRDLLENLDLSSDEEVTKLLIDQMTVTGTTVVVRPNIEGLDEEYSVTIPDVTMSNIGTGEGAENGAEIGRVVTDLVMVLARRALDSDELPPELRAVLSGDLQAVLAQYGDKIKGELREELNEQLDELRGELGENVGGVLDQALEGNTRGAVDEARKTLEDEAREKAQGGLRGLLGGDRQEDRPPTTNPDRSE